MFRSDIVGVDIWLIAWSDVVLCSEYPIESCLCMGPSVVATIPPLIICSARTLCIEYSLYRPPSSWDIVLESEIVLWCGYSTRSSREPDSIELSYLELPIIYDFG